MVINGKFSIGDKVFKIGDTPMPHNAMPRGEITKATAHPITGYEIYCVEWAFHIPRYSFERGTDILPA